MSPPRILDRAALEAKLFGPRFLLFKHSPICPVSARAFAAYEAFFEGRADVATGWIDVIGQRDLSGRVSERSGVRHESPQAILFEAGEPVWNASHRAITVDALEAVMSRGA